jgi:hypothetical protein
MLLEYPIPELYMQEVTDADGNQKHLLVDGQQRITALLTYLNGDYELEDESPHWGGLSFEDLAQQDRKRIFEYSFVVRLLPEMPDDEVRAIFQRVNRNTTVLNAQELRHATYWGPFIKLMEEMSDFEFWSAATLFSANERRRMLDIEFISELSVAVLNGLQNKKKLLEEFYQQYETNFEDSDKLRTIFIRVLGEIEQLLPDIGKTRWRKKSDFYTLFVKLASHADQLPLAADQRFKVSAILHGLAEDVDSLIKEGDPTLYISKQAADYLKHVERAASDLGARRERQKVLDYLLADIFPVPLHIEPEQ